jgi:hypothetical protein
MKYLEYILKTYVYSHCNMCNIPIYFGNIDITYNISLKHLKHLKHMLAICAFSAMSPCCLDEWRLVVAELDTGAEPWTSAAVRSSPVRQRREQLAGRAAPQEAPPLTCLLEHLSWRLAGSVEWPQRANAAVEAAQWRQSREDEWCGGGADDRLSREMA